MDAIPRMMRTTKTTGEEMKALWKRSVHTDSPTWEEHVNSDEEALQIAMIISIEDQTSENYAHNKYKPANFTSADWKQWNDAADPSDAPYAEAKTEAPDLLTQEQFRDLQWKYCMQNNETNEFEMPVEIVYIWIRKLQSDGKLPQDCLFWRSLCGSTIAELLHKAENKAARPDP